MVVDIAAKVRIGRITMYAMIGTDAFESSGIAPTAIAPLWKVFALARMLNGLESYCLRS